ELRCVRASPCAWRALPDSGDTKCWMGHRLRGPERAGHRAAGNGVPEAPQAETGLRGAMSFGYRKTTASATNGCCSPFFGPGNLMTSEITFRVAGSRALRSDRPGPPRIDRLRCRRTAACNAALGSQARAVTPTEKEFCSLVQHCAFCAITSEGFYPPPP